MKYRHPILALLITLAIWPAACITPLVMPANTVLPDEKAAIKKIGDDIYFLRHQMQNKRIGIYHFTSIHWEITPAGKRISASLADYLRRKGGLSLVPRAELDSIMEEHAIEKASIYDLDTLQKKGRVLPIDIIVIGTIGPADGTVQIAVKVVNVSSGRLMLATGARVPATGELASREDPGIMALNKKSPEKIVAMNQAYYTLKWMKSRRALVFLMAVLTDDEMKSIKTAKPVLSEKLAVRSRRYQDDRPDVMKKISALKNGYKLITRYKPRRAEEISTWKKELLARMR